MRPQSGGDEDVPTGRMKQPPREAGGDSRRDEARDEEPRACAPAAACAR